MGNQHETTPRSGMTCRYRLGGTVHPIQARKAWEDAGSWAPGVLLGIDGDTATVKLVDPSELTGGIPDDVRVSGSDDGPMARGAFQIAEASLDDMPVNGVVWVTTHRWGVLAFPDDDGNAVALRPLTSMAGTIFVRAAAASLRFLAATFVEEVSETEPEPRERLTEFVYGLVQGLDGIDRFYVVPRFIAEDTAQIVDIVTSCTTWGEVRETADDDRYLSLLEGAGLDPDDPPGDDEPFDPNEVDGLQSVEFPMTHEVAQETYLPRDLQERFGEWERRMVEGSVLTIPVANGPALVAELEQRGHRCTEEIALLAREHDRFEWM